jgi:hypothetical protein
MKITINVNSKPINNESNPLNLGTEEKEIVLC